MHLLAISGMHVLLLAGSIHKILRWLGAGPRLAAGCTLALAIAYVPLTGGAPPIRRAVTGLAFYGVALVRGRPGDPASALGGAALVSALFEPAQVATVGFRLSFCAAAAISLLASRWSRACARTPLRLPSTNIRKVMPARSSSNRRATLADRMTACERAMAIRDARYRAAAVARARSTVASVCGTATADRTAMSPVTNRISMNV